MLKKHFSNLKPKHLLARRAFYAIFFLNLLIYVSEIKLPKDFHFRLGLLYLDFKRLPFPNRLSYIAEILRQSGLQTAGRTKTAGCTAATAGYL
jgi:hypothetical protein